MFEDFELIHSYTRKQAIQDGDLIDVSEWASQVGIKWPVAFSAALWSGYIDVSDSLKKLRQSAQGRVWDVLNVVRDRARGK